MASSKKWLEQRKWKNEGWVWGRGGGVLRFTAEDGEIEIKVLDSAVSVVSWKDLHMFNHKTEPCALECGPVCLFWASLYPSNARFSNTFWGDVFFTQCFGKVVSTSGIHKILEGLRNPKIKMTQDLCWEPGHFTLRWLWRQLKSVRGRYKRSILPEKQIPLKFGLGSEYFCDRQTGAGFCEPEVEKFPYGKLKHDSCAFFRVGVASTC